VGHGIRQVSQELAHGLIGLPEGELLVEQPASDIRDFPGTYVHPLGNSHHCLDYLTGLAGSGA
jgi:hypothetical protein